MNTTTITSPPPHARRARLIALALLGSDAQLQRVMDFIANDIDEATADQIIRELNDPIEYTRGVMRMIEIHRRARHTP